MVPVCPSGNWEACSQVNSGSLKGYWQQLSFCWVLPGRAGSGGRTILASSLTLVNYLEPSHLPPAICFSLPREVTIQKYSPLGQMRH